MSPDHDSPVVPDPEPPDDELSEDDGPPSIFRSTWVRVVLVVFGVALVSAVAVPYVLDAVVPPQTGAVASAPVPAPSAPVPVASAPVPAPSAPAPAASAPAPPVAAPAPVATPTASERQAPPQKPASPSIAKPVAKPVTEPKATAPADAAPRAQATAAAKPTPTVKRAAVTEAPDAGARKRPAVRASAVSTGDAKPDDGAKGGAFFVQVGAFRDHETARRVASMLREQNYTVDESVTRGASGRTTAPAPAPRTTSATASDRYDVLVSGAPASEINTKLAAKGLASETAGESVRIRPALSLRDAVALSKDLSNEGFKVQVRRGGSSAATVAAAVPATSGSETIYRVRVGGYPDRAAALAAARELESKGYNPFIARGRE